MIRPLEEYAENLNSSLPVGPKAKQPETIAFDPIAFTLNGKHISPKCIVLLIDNMAGDGARDKITLPDPNDCNDEYHFQGEGEVELSDDSIEFSQDGENVRYKHLYSKLDNIHVFQLWEYGGGSGVFSSLIVTKVKYDSPNPNQIKKKIKNEKLTIKRVDVLSGRDRCTGGFTDLFLKNGKIMVRRNITSDGFFNLLFKNASPDWNYQKSFSNRFADGPRACAGSVVIQITDKGEGFEYIEVDERAKNDLFPFQNKKWKNCIINLIPENGKIYKKDISEFVKAIDSTCPSNPRKNK